MTTDQMIQQYRDAAIKHGVASDGGDSRRANKFFREGTRLSHFFRRGDQSMQDAFTALLDDINPWIRCRAATHALEFAPDEAIQVLEQLASGTPGLVRLSAEMVLSRWREGTLRIP